MNETTYNNPGRSSGMEQAALILGIFSLLLIATGTSVIIGSVGIILALLSRGGGSLTGKAKAGLITSLIGIIGGFAVTLLTFSLFYSGDPDQTMNRLNSLYETYINEGTLDPADLDRVFSDDNAADSDKTALTGTLMDAEENLL